MDELPEDYKAWLKGRPKVVVDLLTKYKPGDSFTDPEGAKVWLIGATDDGKLVVSYINPLVDYQKALDERWELDPAEALSAPPTMG